MTKNKKAQKARRLKSKEECVQSLRAAANAVVELVRDMPGLDGLEGGLEVDQAVLAAADYNCECICCGFFALVVQGVLLKLVGVVLSAPADCCGGAGKDYAWA
jgi:hypothetical protein